MEQCEVVMKHIQRMSLLIGLGMIICAAGFSTGAAQTMRGLQRIPPDTAEARRVRIWVPQEMQGACRLTVDIYNDSGQVIRHLVNALIQPSYYNFYWDKRDDSGHRVPPGEYLWKSDLCGRTRDGTVEAVYNRWEEISDVEPYDPDSPFVFTLVLEEDSIPVSIRVKDYRDIQRDSVTVDTLLNEGVHTWHYEPGRRLREGNNYLIHIEVGEHTYYREVTYLP